MYCPTGPADPLWEDLGRQDKIDPMGHWQQQYPWCDRFVKEKRYPVQLPCG